MAGTVRCGWDSVKVGALLPAHAADRLFPDDADNLTVLGEALGPE